MVAAYTTTGRRRPGRPRKVNPRQDYLAARPAWGLPTGGYRGWSHGVWETLAEHPRTAATLGGVRLREQMLLDPTVASAVNTLKSSILADGVQLVPAEGAGDDSPAAAADPTSPAADANLADEIAQFCQRCLDDLDRPLEAILWELLDCIGHGVKLAEVTYAIPDEGVDAGKFVFASVKVKPQHVWSFVRDRYGNLLGIRPAGPSGGVPASPMVSTSDINPDELLPLDKFLILSWNPRDDDPRGQDALQVAWNAWNEKIQIPPQRWLYLSRFAVPSLFGTTAPNAQKVPVLNADGTESGRYVPAVQALLDGLVAVQNGSSAAGPDGTKVQLIEAQGEGAAFKLAADECRREIIFAILQTSMGILESEHFSRSNAESGQDITSTFVRLVKRAIGGVVRRMLLQPLVAKNYGAEAARRYTPVVMLGMVEMQDFSRNANAVARLADAGVVTGEMRSGLLTWLGLAPLVRWIRRVALPTPMQPVPIVPVGPAGGPSPGVPAGGKGPNPAA